MSGSLTLRMSSALNALGEALERMESLDSLGDLLAKAVGPLVSKRPVNDTLTGAPIGHPLHPALVAVPIGSWTAATYLDLTGGDEDAAARLLGLGVVTAVPTALSGAADWLTTQGAERRVGVVHASLNSVALLLYSASWLSRRRGRHAAGVAMALAGAGAVAVSGWLGGHLAYALGVGVDTTSFQHLPEEWTDAAAESDLAIGQPLRRDIAGAPLLLVRTNEGVHALADRCSHRGGPLDEGEFSAGCITCPWHGSTFRVTDGEVVAGPASRPQTVLEVRTREGRIQVRRSAEERSLRTNPIGV